MSQAPLIPWYVAGPLIGLVVPLLLIFGGKVFGVSANLRHLCAAAPSPRRFKPDFFRYNWREAGLWNLAFAAGIILGGALSVLYFGTPDAGGTIASATQEALRAIGLTSFSGMMPAELASWKALTTPTGIALLLGGGFLVGFGARYAGGCTSGHAISGLADLQGASLVAVFGFFAGGLLATHLLLPLLLG